MKLIRVITSAFLILALTAGASLAQSEKAKKQAEIRKVTTETLERFYKAEPKLKADVAKSVGYGVFTTYGFSFFVGGSGGNGLVHDMKTKKDVYMSMAQASAGIQIGAAESDTLIIFKTPQAMQNFVNKGWEFGAGGGAGAGAAGASAGGAAGENVISDALYYTITKNGLQAGGAVAGTKFWKDKDLN